MGEQASYEPGKQSFQTGLFWGQRSQQAAKGTVYAKLLLGPHGGIGAGYPVTYVQALLQGDLRHVRQLCHDPSQRP